MRRLTLVVLVALAGCAGSDNSADSDEQAPGSTQVGATQETGASPSAVGARDLDGWTPRGEATWTVEDGAFTPVVESGRGFLVSNESYEDFRLTVEFWVDDTANGGVFLRVPESGEIDQFNSFEVNIFDAHADWPTGSINEIQRTTAPESAGQWNTFEITAEGDRVTVSLNGESVVDARGERQPRGHIALQYNGSGSIRYRNVEVQPL